MDKIYSGSEKQIRKAWHTIAEGASARNSADDGKKVQQIILFSMSQAFHQQFPKWSATTNATQPWHTLQKWPEGMETTDTGGANQIEVQC